ncbi:hypothetical protein ACF09H_25665 [Streptomyces sp. NPDC014983]|uniref:hypothetical protein n=1 Tax=Streptomyces sp. NPDC014983 TaxID=3364933 RepID=UPI0036F723E5
MAYGLRLKGTASGVDSERVELARFFKVSVRRFDSGHSAPEMFSTAVDSAWHRLMETPGYAEFCAEHVGRTIGHRPVKGVGEISWIPTYEEMFGPLSVLWFTDEDGRIDEEALARYRRTGVVVAAWDCSPVPGDGGDVAPHEPVTTTTR